MWQGSWEQVLPVVLAGVLEGLGVPWPGAVIVAAAGLAAGDGMTGLLVLSVLFSIAYVVGSLGQYAAGAMLGPGALNWLPREQRVKLQAMMRRYGTAAVIWTRPLAVGNYVSAPAGILRMPIRTFSAATFAGIFPWALGMLLIGKVAGASFTDLGILVSTYGTEAVVAVAVLSVAWALRKRLLRRRPESLPVLASRR